MNAHSVDDRSRPVTAEAVDGVQRAVLDFLEQVARTPKATVKGMPPLQRPPASSGSPEGGEQ